MELGGWKSLSMMQRYGHLSPQHKAEVVKKLDLFRNAFTTARIVPSSRSL